jgi:hypothetical protein
MVVLPASRNTDGGTAGEPGPMLAAVQRTPMGRPVLNRRPKLPATLYVVLDT